MRTRLRSGRALVSWAVLALSLAACTTAPVKQDDDLSAVLEAYRRQSAELVAQRQAREQRQPRQYDGPPRAAP